MFKFVNWDDLDAEVSTSSIISFKVKTLLERHWSSGCELRDNKTVSASQIKVQFGWGGLRLKTPVIKVQMLGMILNIYAPNWVTKYCYGRPMGSYSLYYKPTSINPAK